MFFKKTSLKIPISKLEILLIMMILRMFIFLRKNVKWWNWEMEKITKNLQYLTSNNIDALDFE